MSMAAGADERTVTAAAPSGIARAIPIRGEWRRASTAWFFIESGLYADRERLFALVEPEPEART